MAVGLALTVLGCRSQNKETRVSPQTACPLDVPVMRQHILPPPESVALLDAVEHGAAPPHYDHGPFEAAEGVWEWTVMVLRAPYRPRGDTKFLAFPMESGRFDVVRTRFATIVDGEETRFKIAGTRSVMSIAITPKREERLLACRDRVQRVTERTLLTGQWHLADGEVTFLDGGIPLDLIEQGASGSFVYGAPRGPRVVPDPYWEQDLRWWCTPEEVGIVFLIGPGRPNPHQISWELLDNGPWFNAYE
jgi:hypothetical protein